MAVLSDIYIKVETLKTILETLEKKGEKGISLTIAINDETTKYGNNLSGYISQTKEQREAKKDKFYVGNGKVFWTDGKVSVATKQEAPVGGAVPTAPASDQDLPF